MRRRKLSNAIVGVCSLLVVANASANPLLAEAQRLATAEIATVEAKPHIPLTGGMDEADIKTALSNFNKLKWTHIPPVNNLVMVENEQGDHILMDTDARIAIRGKVEVFDMWNKRPIKTKADAKASWLVSLDSFNIKSGDLASFRYGLLKDKPDMTVLVDPKGDYNAKLFDQMKTMAGEYSFEIVLAPLLGEDSVMESLKLWCAKDREASLEQLMSQSPIKGQVFPTCDKDPLIKALGVAGLLHLKGLPHLIRADGLQLQGTPDSLSEFMSRNTDNLGEVKVNEVKPSK